ncbi:hypothetical protein [Aeoliella mucimassa]|uniref:Uncharacterized protein n=1 Tax=Aeoliella mucimassa TaxID=2527972 RepID=A0A518ANS0_9BACT|nr:hypothetical protein [Aeoliella mucimassa]QDU56364.1 hypothetical protein Pan181_25730 [Aeoliella mucimassa]
MFSVPLIFKQVHRPIARLIHNANDVLRRAEWTTDAERWQTALPRLVVCIVVFAFVFGASMGSYRGFTGQSQWLLQMTYSAIKVPILLCGSFALTLPPFFVFSSLVGLRAGFGPMVRALAAAQAGLAVTLSSLAPLTLVVYASTTEYDIALLSSALLFGVAGIAGQAILRWHCRPLIASNPRWRKLLVLWATVYALVAIQLAWLLRPFFGAPNVPVTFFRPQAWDNAYVMMLRLVWRTLFE